MVDSGVWNQVPRLHDQLEVGTEPVFKRKIDKDGEIEKYKARLVVQRFPQVEGIHYTDSYSPTPTAAINSVRILLAIAEAQDLELRHLDFLSERFSKQTWTRTSMWSIPKAIKLFRVRLGS